jgi:hypothetical protein
VAAGRPPLPDLRTGAGFTLDLWLDPVPPGPPDGGPLVLDTRAAGGAGLLLERGGAGGDVSTAAGMRSHAAVRRMRPFGRVLRTSEAVGSYLSGPDG